MASRPFWQVKVYFSLALYATYCVDGCCICASEEGSSMFTWFSTMVHVFKWGGG